MIKSHKLMNKFGNSVEIINYGARIGRILLNTNGGPRNVSLTYPQLDNYINDPYYLGATVGRYANRLKLENGDILLHGGKDGLHAKYWNIKEKSDTHVILSYISKDGEEGFTGTIKIEAEFSWSEQNTLSIKYKATTDKKTIINLTSHPYFNLDGQGTINQHKLKILADKYTNIDNDLIPTGEFQTIEKLDLNWREKESIHNKEIDHNFVLNDKNMLKYAASLSSSNDDITLVVETNQLGLQFYTGHYLRAPFISRAGLCLEAQNFPDAPNHPHFPSALLMPGETYSNHISYNFSLGFDHSISD